MITYSETSPANSAPTVLVLDPMHQDALAHLGIWSKPVYDPQRRDWRHAGRDAAGLIVRHPIAADDLAFLPTLAAIVRAGSGLDGIPLDYARSRGIEVRNTPGVNADAVAEYVFAAILHAARSPSLFDTINDADAF